MQQIPQDLIDVAFPFWQIGNGQNGIDSVVPSAVDGLNVKTIQLKNAENVSVLNDALGQTNSVVPIIRFSSSGRRLKAVKSILIYTK